MLCHPIFNITGNRTSVNKLLHKGISSARHKEEDPTIENIMVNAVLYVNPIIIREGTYSLPTVYDNTFRSDVLLYLINMAGNIVTKSFRFSNGVTFCAYSKSKFRQISVAGRLSNKDVNFISSLRKGLSNSKLFGNGASVMRVVKIDMQFYALTRDLHNAFRTTKARKIRYSRESSTSCFGVKFRGILFDEGVTSQSFVMSRILSKYKRVGSPNFKVVSHYANNREDRNTCRNYNWWDTK